MFLDIEMQKYLQGFLRMKSFIRTETYYSFYIGSGILLCFIRYLLSILNMAWSNKLILIHHIIVQNVCHIPLTPNELLSLLNH